MLSWYNLTKVFMLLAIASIGLLAVTKWWWIVSLACLSFMAAAGQAHNLVTEQEKQVEEDISDKWGMKVGDRE